MPDEPSEPMPAQGSNQAAHGGLTAAEILDQPEPARGLLSWMCREDQVDLPAIVAFLGQDEPTARSVLAAVEEKGYVQRVQVDGVTYFRVRLVNKRSRKGGAGWLPTFEDN